MQAIGENLAHRKTTAIAIEDKELNTIAIDDREIDLLLLDKQHLICKEFKAWYCKWIKSNGTQAFVRLAAQADQEGKNKPKYFSWLLKNHVA